MPDNDKKIPFSGDNDAPSEQSKKIGLNKVSSQKSIFDNAPKRPPQEDFRKQVQKKEEHISANKSRMHELAINFNKAMEDKTLPQNKNIFQRDMEIELLRNMSNLAQEINSDPNELDGVGSLSWVVLLLKNCFAQRNRANNLEYELSLANDRLDAVEKRLKELDKPANNE